MAKLFGMLSIRVIQLHVGPKFINFAFNKLNLIELTIVPAPRWETLQNFQKPD